MAGRSGLPEEESSLCLDANRSKNLIRFPLRGVFGPEVLRSGSAARQAPAQVSAPLAGGGPPAGRDRGWVGSEDPGCSDWDRSWPQWGERRRYAK